jgi:hypothetical protein
MAIPHIRADDSLLSIRLIVFFCERKSHQLMINIQVRRRDDSPSNDI